MNQSTQLLHVNPFPLRSTPLCVRGIRRQHMHWRTLRTKTRTVTAPGQRSISSYEHNKPTPTNRFIHIKASRFAPGYS